MANEESSLTTDLIPPLSAEEAQNLTDRIKQSVEEVCRLVWEAYNRHAWKALGYSSWSRYVESEFSYSRSYAYRLLDHARVVNALEGAVAEGMAVKVSPIGDTERITIPVHFQVAPATPPFRVTESQARVLKPVLPNVVDVVTRSVAGGMAPEDAVAIAIQHARRRPTDEEMKRIEANINASIDRSRGAIKHPEDRYESTRVVENVLRAIQPMISISPHNAAARLIDPRFTAADLRRTGAWLQALATVMDAEPEQVRPGTGAG